MNMSKETYKKYADARAPKSPVVKDCFHAFLVGGFICAFAQGLTDVYTKLCGMEKEDAGTLTACTLVLIAAILTGLGVFDRIAKFAGAGTLVPITGFANAVVSPAVEFKSETMTLGSCTKMFTIAGPVIVYGVTASVIYGIVLVLLQSF